MKVTEKLAQMAQKFEDFFDSDRGVFKGENGKKMLDEILEANWTFENRVPVLFEKHFITDVYVTNTRYGNAEIRAYTYIEETETHSGFVELVLINKEQILGRIRGTKVTKKYFDLRTSNEECLSQPTTHVL